MNQGQLDYMRVNLILLGVDVIIRRVWVTFGGSLPRNQLPRYN